MMNRLDKSVERMKKTSGRKMKIQDWRKEKKS